MYVIINKRNNNKSHLPKCIQNSHVSKKVCEIEADAGPSYTAHCRNAVYLHSSTTWYCAVVGCKGSSTHQERADLQGGLGDTPRWLRRFTLLSAFFLCLSSDSGRDMPCHMPVHNTYCKPDQLGEEMGKSLQQELTRPSAFGRPPQPKRRQYERLRLVNPFSNRSGA